MSERSLNTRQLKFVQIYAGNGTDAARQAGYTGSEDVLGKTAYDLLRNPKIMEAIKERETKEMRPKIITRLERQKFWSDVISDESVDMRDRLRASELLGKSEADFTERIEASVSYGLSDRLKKARERVQFANEK